VNGRQAGQLALQGGRRPLGAAEDQPARCPLDLNVLRRHVAARPLLAVGSTGHLGGLVEHAERSALVAGQRVPVGLLEHGDRPHPWRCGVPARGLRQLDGSGGVAALGRLVRLAGERVRDHR